MKTISAKEFIKSYFIDGVYNLTTSSPYFAFIIMGIGIEFLGKCLDNALDNWVEPNRSKTDFEKAINDIPPLQKYIPYLDPNGYFLYRAYRCGLAHSAVPNHQITLSSKTELGHLIENNNRLNLKIEDFYEDFKAACEFVIALTEDMDNKINKPFLEIPDDSSNNISTNNLSASGSASFVISQS